MLSSLAELGNKLCLTLTLGCLLSGVTLAQTVTTGRAVGVNFSKYHTYKWVAIKGQHFDPSVDAQIKQSIDSQLAVRGLTKANDGADLDVAYQVAIKQEEKWQAYEDWKTESTFGEQRFPQRKLVTIEIGTLVIDMYDTAAKELVWEGRASKTLDPSSSQKDRQGNIDNAAKKLLAKFPPK
jgi:hypothetical protein